MCLLALLWRGPGPYGLGSELTSSLLGKRHSYKYPILEWHTTDITSMKFLCDIFQSILNKIRLHNENILLISFLIH